MLAVVTEKIAARFVKQVRRNLMQNKALEDDFTNRFILFVKSQGYGYSFRLAHHLGVTPGYIGHLLKRRQAFSVNLAERIIEKGLPK